MENQARSQQMGAGRKETWTSERVARFVTTIFWGALTLAGALSTLPLMLIAFVLMWGIADGHSAHSNISPWQVVRYIIYDGAFLIWTAGWPLLLLGATILAGALLAKALSYYRQYRAVLAVSGIVLILAIFPIKDAFYFLIRFHEVGGFFPPLSDPATFNFLQINLIGRNGPYVERSRYARDANAAYCDNHKLLNVDPKTLQNINTIPTQVGSFNYAIDNVHAFYECKIIPGADPNALKLFEKNSDFSTDMRTVYFQGAPIPGADPKTFEPVFFGKSRDAKHTYDGTHISD